MSGGSVLIPDVEKRLGFVLRRNGGVTEYQEVGPVFDERGVREVKGRGFTMVETILAVGVVATVIASLVALFAMGLDRSRDSLEQDAILRLLIK